MKLDKDLTNTIKSNSFSVNYTPPKIFSNLIEIHESLLKFNYEDQSWRVECLKLFIKTCSPIFNISSEDVTNDNIIEYIENYIEINEFVIFTNNIKNALESLVSGSVIEDDRVSSIKYMSSVFVDLKPFTRTEDEYEILKGKKTQKLNASALLVLHNKEAYSSCINDLLAGNISKAEFSDKILFHVEPYIELFVESLLLNATKQTEDGKMFSTSKRTEEDIKNMVKSDSLTPSQNLTPKQAKITRQNAAKLAEIVRSGALNRFVNR